MTDGENTSAREDNTDEQIKEPTGGEAKINGQLLLLVSVRTAPIFGKVRFADCMAYMLMVEPFMTQSKDLTFD